MYSHLKVRYLGRRPATTPTLPSLHRARIDDANKNTRAAAITRLGPREQLCWIYRLFFDAQRHVHHPRNGLCLAKYPRKTLVSSFQTPGGHLFVRLPWPAEIQQQCPQAVGHVLRDDPAVPVPRHETLDGLVQGGEGVAGHMGRRRRTECLRHVRRFFFSLRPSSLRIFRLVSEFLCMFSW